jgi:hypothetical protein
MLQAYASLGATFVGLGALVLSAYTTRLTLRHQASAAQDSRLWERRAETYVELLNILQQADVQDWAAPGSVAWENLIGRNTHGKVLAFGSAAVQAAWFGFVFAKTQEDRHAALTRAICAITHDLHGSSRHASIEQSWSG